MSWTSGTTTDIDDLEMKERDVGQTMGGPSRLAGLRSPAKGDLQPFCTISLGDCGRQANQESITTSRRTET